MPDDSGDKLSREVAIAATLEENGVKVKTQSRAVAALDGLVGAILDWPTAYLEGEAKKKRVRDSIDEQLRRAQAAVAEAQIAGRGELGGVLIDAVLVERARKQKNAAGVAIEAVEQMKALPPPEADQEENPSAPDDPLDDDWMNMFIRFAEDASSDQLQQLWGRVLAGEVSRKGSFSRQTLRFIAELDGETAENCEWAASYSLTGDWLPKGDDWVSGTDLMRLIDLQRLGMLEGVTANGPTRKLKLGADGTLVHFQGKKGLWVVGEQNAEIQVGVILVTRLGREVFSLLPVNEEGRGLLRLAEVLKKDNRVKKAAIGDATSVGGNRWFVSDATELWER